LYPQYRSWSQGYQLWEATSRKELEGFRFSAPRNPVQTIIDILKTYFPGRNDSSIVTQLSRYNTIQIAYAIYSLIEETSFDTNPFADKVQTLQE